MLLELERKYGDEGLRLVAVSMDEAADPAGLVRSFFADELKTEPPLVIFPDEATATSWKVFNLPTLYILDRQGTIVAAHAGLRPEEVLDRDVRRALGKQ